LFPGDETASSESQTSAAIRMARIVALKLLPDRNATDLPRPTASVAAWTQLLQGRALMSAGSPDDVRRAIAAFESAVAADPSLAAAWAKIAEARHVLVMMGAAAPLDSYPLARTAADRALAAAPAMPEAHLANGIVQLWFDWRVADAARSFERALALNPSSAAAHHDYAWALMALGRTDEAIAQVTLARDLDPLSVRANSDIGWLYLHLRRPLDAARACQRTLAIQPGALEPQACLERSYADRGLFDAALQAAVAGAPKSAPDFPDLAGQRSADALKTIWRWRLARLDEAAKTRWISPYGLAVQRALAGERERAIDALEAAFAQRLGVMAFLATDPSVDPLRGDPRFQRLLTQIAAARH
jgi:tetratricopeptide (TPR) repeat protein